MVVFKKHDSAMLCLSRNGKTDENTMVYKGSFWENESKMQCLGSIWKKMMEYQKKLVFLKIKVECYVWVCLGKRWKHNGI